MHVHDDLAESPKACERDASARDLNVCCGLHVEPPRLRRVSALAEKYDEKRRKLVSNVPRIGIRRTRTRRVLTRNDECSSERRDDTGTVVRARFVLQVESVMFPVHAPHRQSARSAPPRGGPTRHEAERPPLRNRTRTWCEPRTSMSAELRGFERGIPI